MRTNLKRLKRTKKSSPSESPVVQKSWAERHGPLATIISAYSTLLAVIIAGLGYYFTVVPLYQKAAVDELIAKREIELAEAKQDIVLAKREAYEQRRDNFKRLIEFSAANCSGIDAVIRHPRAITGDLALLREQHNSRINLETEVAPCLAAVLLKYKAKNILTSTDYNFVELLFSRLGDELDKKRIEEIVRIKALPEIAARDPNILSEVGPAMQRLDELQQDWDKRISNLGIRPQSPEDREEKRFRYRIQITQEKIADEYRLSSTRYIREALDGIKWPKE